MVERGRRLDGLQEVMVDEHLLTEWRTQASVKGFRTRSLTTAVDVSTLGVTALVTTQDTQEA
jgi:hypothetical protein